MGFLEKSKVTLTVRCEVETCSPGDVIPGELHVEVHEKVSFTALRLRFRGEEKFYVEKRDSNNNSYYVHRKFTHVEEAITLMGASSRSAASGTTQLDPGVYTFPYRVMVPAAAPPSFCVKRSEYGCSVVYTMKGYLDIPYGFDAEVKQEVVVRQAVSVAQLQPARQSLQLFPASEAHIAECSCCCGCCLCCVDEESFIRTEAAIAPQIVLMRPATHLPEVMAMPDQQEEKTNPVEAQGGWGQPMPMSADASSGMVRVRVTSFSKEKAPRECKIVLRQHHEFERDGGVSYPDKYTLLSAVVPFPCGPLGYGQSVVVEAPFRVDGSCVELPDGPKMIPSLQAKHITVNTELLITFSGISAEGTFYTQNPILLADDVDMSNKSVAMPYSYVVEQLVAVETDRA